LIPSFSLTRLNTVIHFKFGVLDHVPNICFNLNTQSIKKNIPTQTGGDRLSAGRHCPHLTTLHALTKESPKRVGFTHE
jgi:hypothetical protein